jgi:nucleoside-diphosphate-sugar epimerase
MYRITRIFHLAAMLSTRAEYAPEAAHDVNVTGTMNLLRLASEQARSHGETVRFIYPSSIAVYGMRTMQRKQKAGAVEEGRFNSPTTMYGCNKLYGEHLGRYYSKHYRQLSLDRATNALDFRCLRYPGLISAETLPTGGTSDFGPEMLHAAAAGQHYSCFVRPDSRIPFMTMPAAIRSTLELADADPARLTRSVYNVSAFAPSAEEFASLVRRYFPDAEIEYEPDIQRQGIVDQWPEDVDCTRAKRDWGFDPGETLESAFENYLVPAVRARYASENPVAH